MEAKGGGPLLRLVGHQGSPRTHELREFLDRNDVPYDWIDVDHDPLVRLLRTDDAPSTITYPLCLFPDGTRLEDPSCADVAEKAGLAVRPSQPEYDLAIVGAGPAGLTAAVYGASEGLRTIVVDRDAPGGQAGTSSRIENYLGFPQGISGMELTTRAMEQAVRFGAEIVRANEPVGAHPTVRDPYVVYLKDGSELRMRAGIVASGVSYRLLEAEGIARLTGAGVYYGTAMSEVRFYRDRDVYVVGGANSAGQAAVYLAGYARSVTLLVRGESLDADMSRYLIEELDALPNVRRRLGTRVVAARGEDTLREILVADIATGREETLEADGLFILIGQTPSTEWAAGLLRRDHRGFFVTGPQLREGPERLAGTDLPRWWTLRRDPLPLETSVPGVFAAGDVRSGSTKRVAAAVGEGAFAVALVHHYLRDFASRDTEEIQATNAALAARGLVPDYVDAPFLRHPTGQGEQSVRPR